MTQEERFWARVRKTDSCWLWSGKPMVVGYGCIRFNGRDDYAHRVSWVLHRGVIPTGLCVLHRCDVRLCVNPEHLFLGTRTDNAADRDAKGRQPIGEKHPMRKLTEDAVFGILDWLGDGITEEKTARAFGVSRRCLWSIKTGRTWSHITGIACPS